MIHGSPEGLLEMQTHNSVDVFDINTRCWTKYLCTNDNKLPPTNVGGLSEIDFTHLLVGILVHITNYMNKIWAYIIDSLLARL